MQQGGFAGSIGPDQAHLIPAHDQRGKIPNYRGVPIGEPYPLGLDDQFPGLGRFLDPQGHAPGFSPAGPPDLAQPEQGPNPPFISGAAGLDALSDPGLLLGKFSIQQIVLSFLGFQKRLPSFQIGLVAAGIGEQVPPVQFQHPGGQFH